MKTLILIFSVLTVMLAFTVNASAATLVVADFDSGDKPNNIGGDFGAWNKDENDSTQGCKNRFNSDVKRGRQGFSTELDYDVESPNPAYNGFWMKLQDKDISQYDKLSLWIKGDEANGFSKNVKLELKNSKGHVGKFKVTNITKDWQEISIPLKDFSGLKDVTSMSEFVVVFDDMTCADKKTGTIYIDDITFVK